VFSETYGNAVIRALSRCSRRFLTDPPEDFTATPLTKPRAFLSIAREDQRASLQAFAGAGDVSAATRIVSSAEARQLCPILREDYVAAAALEHNGADIDVHGLHQGYLRRLRRNGGQVLTDAEVQEIRRDGGTWHARSAAGTVSAPILVNAAGAWADRLAALAAVRPIGLVPCRRTALLVADPALTAIDHWPAVIDVDEEFYFKPDAGLLLLSPADETPSEPCDAQPEEIDVAIAIDRVQQAAALDIRAVRRKWAGLRSFVADRSPVIGFDDAVPGFFWIAGQGGYGIQTAPAAARLAAALIRGDRVPEDLRELGVSAETVSPKRLEVRQAVRIAPGA
jgi:D-arginine dehydrogenase